MEPPSETHADLPPAVLEERVVAALHARGLLVPATTAAVGSQGGGRRVAAAAALVLAGLAAAFLVGRASAGGAPTATHMLLLRGSATASVSAGEQRARVAEYGRWAQEQGAIVTDGAPLGRTGAFLRAGDGAVRETAPPASALELSGWFLLRVDSLHAATEVARTCPHLAHGGAIEVRALTHDP
ncbi:MAG: hypothetical protein AAF628_09825 [Planctomycetota bacterium]